MVFVRQDEPLTINTWGEWLGLIPLFIYFADLNKVEWAQGPIFLHDSTNLQGWVAANLNVQNDDRALMFVFLDQGRLYNEAIPTREFENGSGCWDVPMFAMAPSADIPNNMYFSSGFWECVLRKWSLTQFVFPSVPIRFIETSLLMSLKSNGDEGLRKRKWRDLEQSCDSPTKRMCTGDNGGKAASKQPSTFKWGLPEEEEEKMDPTADFCDRAQRYFIEHEALLKIVKARAKFFEEFFNPAEGAMNLHLSNRDYVIRKGRGATGPSQPPRVP